MKLDLVQIIRDNPGCTVTIDNDCWDLTDGAPLVDSDDELVPLKGSTYQANNCHGGAILLALAEIVGINIQAV